MAFFLKKFVTLTTKGEWRPPNKNCFEVSLLLVAHLPLPCCAGKLYVCLFCLVVYFFWIRVNIMLKLIIKNTIFLPDFWISMQSSWKPIFGCGYVSLFGHISHYFQRRFGHSSGPHKNDDVYIVRIFNDTIPWNCNN